MIFNQEFIYPIPNNTYNSIFGGLPSALLPLIVSPDELRSKLPPQWLKFLFIFTKFFRTYPELTGVTLNLPGVEWN
jgi:hypothetical protein